MTKLFSVFLLTCVLLLSVSTNGKKTLQKGRFQSISARVQQELQKVASSIKNLRIASDTDKIELYSMTNELIRTTSQCVAVLNEAVPYVQKTQYKHKLGENILSFEALLRDLHRSVYNDEPYKVQETLASTLEKFSELVGKLATTVVDHHTDTETMITYKLTEAFGALFFTTHKISLRAALITKTNKDIQKELESQMRVFLNNFDKIPFHNDEAIKDEVGRLIKFVTTVGQGVVLKLENWMNLHNNDDDGFNVVKETAYSISNTVDKLHHLVESGQHFPNVVETFKQLHITANNQIMKLADITPSNTPEDQESIRGVLIDDLTVSVAFAADIDLFFTLQKL